MFWSLWNFKSRLLVLDLIFVQTSGFHLVAVTFSQFTALVYVNSLSFHRTTSFVRTIFLTIFAMVAFTSAGQASSMLYSAAVEPSKSISPESLALWFSFSFVLRRVDLVFNRQVAGSAAILYVAARCRFRGKFSSLQVSMK